jgi:hypothetical protein
MKKQLFFYRNSKNKLNHKNKRNFKLFYKVKKNNWLTLTIILLLNNINFYK